MMMPPNSTNPGRVHSCSFCRESFTTAKAMSTHLTTCGNKTEVCPNCNGFVRRAIFIYHRDHHCNDPDESFEQLSGPNPEAFIPTRITHSNTNDDSVFGNRRNITRFASMRVSSSKLFSFFLQLAE